MTRPIPTSAARAPGLVGAAASTEGVETIPCSTCHAYAEAPNDMPHAAPQAAMTWMLRPVEAEWCGKSAAEIWDKLSDPDRNDGRDQLDRAAPLEHDLILHWACNHGGGREPVPFSLQERVDDILV